MVWRIELTDTAAHQLSKAGTADARRISSFLRERLHALDDPRSVGKILKGPLGGLWCYRVGDYWLVCSIEDERLCVLVLRIAHRAQVYR